MKDLGSLIIYKEKRVSKDEYEEILYNSLFSLIDDLLEPPEDPNIIQVTDKNIFVFMPAML